MSSRVFADVDPRTLRLPFPRQDGADLFELALQTARHGSSVTGMPTILVARGTDGELVIVDGVTRAMRVADLFSGTLVHVETIDDLPRPVGAFPSVGSGVVMSQVVADDLMNAVAELRVLFPEWRLGQTLVNLVTAAGGANAGDIWEMEDDRLLEAARRLVERNQGRKADASSADYR
jgi:hypothetical protein